MEEDVASLLNADDQNALNVLFEEYYSPLCLLAFKIVRDRDQAKDIVQEVFIKLWKSRHVLKITTSWKAYLKRATVNTALNYLESGYFQKKHPLEGADLSFYSGTTADEQHAYNELKKRSDEAIENLPLRTRTIFVLIRSDEMSYKEVAETLGISLKAVEKEMMKALQLLRTALRDYLPAATIPFLANIFF
jgi:RNA polymerase sigma-70 factor (ECF subfamily)